MLPWPGAFTYYKGKLLKIFSSRVLESSGPRVSPGEIAEVSKLGIVVAAQGGFLEIRELQLEGKRRMPAEEFASGHKIKPGQILGKI
jgi:methionyl-tRNA formyltransferase